MAEAEAQEGESGGSLSVPVGPSEALPSWAIERLGQLGAKNYSAAGAEAPLALLGLTAYWSGDFSAVDDILALAGELSGEGPWSDDVAARVVLQRSLAGIVASLRGDTATAERCFVDALGPRGGRPVDEALVVALSLRAALCSDGQPERALADVERARSIALSLGDADLAALAAIGEGWALSELGRFDEAIQVFSGALETLPGDLERSVARLRLAEVQLRMGDRAAARESVNAARQVFLDADARYWGARAALLTGAIDRDRGGRWLRLARELAAPDPAYERLFLPDGALRIDLGATPSVSRDGVPVEFLTRHAETAVRLLSISGEDGMSAQELIALFWPEVPVERQRARLRTMLWQARNSLGADAWRLQRSREQVIFDVCGVDVVSPISREAIVDQFLNRKK